MNYSTILEGINYSSVSIDTRTLQPGAVYIAIQGESQDGHDYVAMAKEKGAVAAVVSREISCDIPQIKVSDTTLALGQIASDWRKQFSIPVIAITGSVGKTTTRNMIANILMQAFGKHAVLVPEKNFNNQWGLPLVLTRLHGAHKIAVLEMGMNHLEEIRYLMRIAQPTIGLITNAGTNHIGFLGSRENIAKAKGEMFEELTPHGCAILNCEDRFFSYWSDLLTTQKRITFGLHQGDVRATAIKETEFTLVTPCGEVVIERTLLGEHSIVNAVAATAAVLAGNITDLSIIKRGLEATQPEHGRLEPVINAEGVIILNDTYNGGETSTLSALQVLHDYRSSGRKIAVLGDMSELGELTLSMHQKMGEHVMRFSPDMFIAFGPEMYDAYTVYSGSNKKHFLNHDDVVAFLKSFAKKGDVILLKGARVMAMEKIFQQLV